MGAVRHSRFGRLEEGPVPRNMNSDFESVIERTCC